MGEYSKFLEQDIKIINKEKFAEVVKTIDDNFLSKVLFTNDNNINFSEWDGYKLEGYWFNDIMIILRLLSTCIKGYVEFFYEVGYKYRIVFEEGKIFIETCKDVWNKKNRKELK